MQSNENKVSAGTAAILVKEKSIAELRGNSPFIEWLNEEGFSKWHIHGFFDNIDWVYVNLNSKIYAPGMPGIAITSPLGQHAVTASEFKIIYEIFKRYEGKAVLVME